MKRRAMLTVIPGALVATAVPAMSGAIPKREPRSEIMDLYQKWCAAEAEFSYQGDLRGYGDETKEERAAGRRASKLRARLLDCQPKTLPEVAAMLHILWDTLGWQPDEEDTFWNGGAPSLLASIWRGASGQEGVPRVQMHS